MARQNAATIRAKRKRQRKAARATGVKKAPGELEIVRAFVSTAPRGKRADELATPERLGRWLEQRGLLDAGIDLGEKQQQRALGLRRGLRTLMLANSGVKGDGEVIARIEEAAAAGRFALRFEAGIPTGIGSASRRFDDALGAIAGIVLMARLEGHWPQLKICAAGDCGRAFFDTSPNHTGVWCAPRCGERFRAAARRRSDRGGR